jgi:simple sugar transport system permease protein
MGLNGLAMGLTPFLNKLAFGVTSSTPSLPLELRFSYAPIVLLMCLVLSLQLGLRHLRGGLWLRTAGENAEALEAAGRSSQWTRWTAIILSGITAALGGAALSTMLASQFSRQMTAGTGFMAIAALILGRWRPLTTAAVCLLFGLTEAMQIRLQTSLSGDDSVWFLPLVPLLPYLITLLVLGSRWGTAKAPSELGQTAR